MGLLETTGASVHREAIKRFGNTVGSSFMFALYDALEKGLITDQELMMLAFGAELKMGGLRVTPIGNPGNIIIP